MDFTEKTVGQAYHYKGRIINLRVDEIILPNGKHASREVVEHPGGVCVAPLDEEGNLYFVRQFRYPYGEALLELPAGKLEKGKPPLPAGIRELEEEVGAKAERLEPMGQLYPSPGYCGEIITLYAATGLSFGETHPDADEFLSTEKIPLETAVQMVMAGEIKDAKTQVLVLKLWQKHTGS